MEVGEAVVDARSGAEEEAPDGADHAPHVRLEAVAVRMVLVPRLWQQSTAPNQANEQSSQPKIIMAKVGYVRGDALTLA